MHIPGTLNVLIVEDDYNTRITIRVMLQEIGIRTIFEAEDGKAAEEAISENRGKIDLVISDWNMPNKTGFEFLKDLRANRPDIPFLMVTARADQDSVVTAKNTGVNGYLLKPFTLEELKKKIFCVLPKQPLDNGGNDEGEAKSDDEAPMTIDIV